MRLVVSLATIVLILTLGYLVPCVLFPRFILDSTVAPSLYGALLQAFAALFSILGMFFVFKVERLDAEIDTVNSALRTQLGTTLDPMSGSEYSAFLPTRVNPVAVLRRVADAIARKDEKPSPGKYVEERDDYLERQMLIALAPELTDNSLRLLSRQVERELIFKRVKWPLSLVATMNIICVLLLATSQGLHICPHIDLGAVVIVSLLAVWAFVEVFVFTWQTLFKAGAEHRTMAKRLGSLLQQIFAEEQSPKEEKSSTAERPAETL